MAPRPVEILRRQGGGDRLAVCLYELWGYGLCRIDDTEQRPPLHGGKVTSDRSSIGVLLQLGGRDEKKIPG